MDVNSGQQKNTEAEVHVTGACILRRKCEVIRNE